MEDPTNLPDVYTVTGQTPVTQYDQMGEPTKGIEVRFRVEGHDIAGSVFVPGETPNPDAARELIRAWVLGALQINDLTN